MASTSSAVSFTPLPLRRARSSFFRSDAMLLIAPYWQVWPAFIPDLPPGELRNPRMPFERSIYAPQLLPRLGALLCRGAAARALGSASRLLDRARQKWTVGTTNRDARGPFCVERPPFFASR